MGLDSFLEQFEVLADAPNGVAKLRKMILQLAVQGKLVPQDPDDERVGHLLAAISQERGRLVGAKKIRNYLLLPEVEDADVPYQLPAGWCWTRFGNIIFNRDAERIPLSRADRQMRQGAYDYYGASGVIDTIDDYLFDKSLLLI